MEEGREFKRVLIKLSGEALMGQQSCGFDPQVISRICLDITEVVNAGKQVCVVIGGGNIYRGTYAKSMGIDRVSGDYMGMLATAINALALQSKLESSGIVTRVQSSIPMTAICENYIRRRAVRHMEKGRVVIFACGTGSPFFTTDAGAALKASEIQADVIIKGTQVDGVYSADPKLDPHATKYDKLSYRDVITKDLKVMDTAAITLACDNKIPIIVCNIHTKGSLLGVLQNKGKYTIIS